MSATFKLAITSIIPKTNPQRHYFLGDLDDCDEPPKVEPEEWLVETRPRHYHVFNYSRNLDILQLLGELIARKADTGFIMTTKKHGFAMLQPHGKILQRGVLPENKIWLCKYEP